MQTNRSWLRFTVALALTGAMAAACSEDDPGTGPEELGAPSSLTLQIVANGVQLSWAAVVGATGYTIERKTSSETSFGALASSVAGTQYTDETVQPGNTYDYRVRAVAGSEMSDPSAIERVDIEEETTPTAVLSADITGVRQLSRDTLYILQGRVRVLDGAELRIPAGTVIHGDASVTPTFLVIERGATITAEGTAADPIIFTSSRPVGQRQRGDWGGVVINGAAQCNLAANNDCVSEGGGGFFGGNDNADNSGVLRYVRIEFVGYEVSLGNELNGLTLNGVGSGTTIEFIQVHQGLDDGVEWFGGTVNAKNLIVTGASDDSFDYCCGFAGKGQFWIGVQDPDDADQGFEIDNNETDNDALPRVNPTVFNVTLVGKGPTGGTAGESTQGILYRRGAWGTLRNFIVTGFETGLDIDNTATYNGCASGDFVLSNSLFADNGVHLNTDADDETACTGLATWTIQQTSPNLPAPYVWPDLGDLNVVPAAGSPAASGAATPPNDGFFDTSATYIGAVAPGSTSPWYAGWIETSAN
jgi:hypothetical protein